MTWNICVTSQTRLKAFRDRSPITLITFHKEILESSVKISAMISWNLDFSKYSYSNIIISIISQSDDILAFIWSINHTTQIVSRKSFWNFFMDHFPIFFLKSDGSNRDRDKNNGTPFFASQIRLGNFMVKSNR